MHNSISKTLIQKIGLYITREFESEYLAVKELDIDEQMLARKLKSLPLVIINTKTFVVIDKPEYDLVLGNN
ncbi:851_t:CDS:2 [Funneliformis mosseae]|uniref:851_t:CDS:1 n=1 Tax=Funneliformis mosseae TaxID=27381 RepID=A0A9N9FBF4_FUNMO|nr:851_t:CDS:2 [Funneliformis mosseae]